MFHLTPPQQYQQKHTTILTNKSIATLPTHHPGSKPHTRGAQRISRILVLLTGGVKGVRACAKLTDLFWGTELLPSNSVAGLKLYSLCRYSRHFQHFQHLKKAPPPAISTKVNFIANPLSPLHLWPNQKTKPWKQKPLILIPWMIS